MASRNDSTQTHKDIQTSEKSPLGTVAKIIRVITVAPVMALFVLLTMFFARPELVGGTLNFLLAVFFLTITPLLAYPLQPVIPRFKDLGREGQRSLAMIFAASGYALGFISSIITKAPFMLFVLYLTYMLTAALLLLFNKAFHLKASGHAAGTVGPLCFIIYIMPTFIPICIIVIAGVFWSSLYMKRHTIWQLLGGIACTLAALALAVLIGILVF